MFFRVALVNGIVYVILLLIVKLLRKISVIYVNVLCCIKCYAIRCVVLSCSIRPGVSNSWPRGWSRTADGRKNHSVLKYLS